MAEKVSTLPEFKIFDLYDIKDIEVKDNGLKSVINLEPKLILKEQGRNTQKFGQIKVNIVERLMNRLAVAGHGERNTELFLDMLLENIQKT